MRLHGGLITLALMAPTAAVAADAPRPAIVDEHRLSPADVQKVLDAAAARQAVAVQNLDPFDNELLLPAPKIAGEFGVAIGTGGYREAFGTAIVPLGNSGEASFSFDTIESNRGRIRRY